MRAFKPTLILLLVVSCSTLKTSSSKKGGKTPEQQRKIEIIPSSPQEEDKIASPTAIEARDEEAPAKNEKLKSFGVFIDSSGYDAFAALGFLQELEKNGMKPVKIMGVGFGCYAALAWASEDSGNKAEWEALKFDSWGLISKGSVVGRIVTRNPKERFKADFQKSFSKDSFSQLKLPADCPVLNKTYPFSLRTGASADLAEMVWMQLQIPSLVAEANVGASNFLSGAMAGNVSDREWSEISKPQSQNSDFAGWIHIKTRNSFEVIGDDNWAYTVFGRLDRETREKAQRKVGNFKIYQVDLAQGQGRNSESLVDPNERRKSLLEGRRKANTHVSRLQIWLRE
jgi:hypothetical protein